MLKQFAKSAGATVIATTSTPEKEEILKKLGADHVINYKKDPNWGVTARKLTPHEEGVDIVVEVGGPGTLEQSTKCVRYEGTICLIGFLGAGDPKGQPQIMDALSGIFTIRGVYVGGRDLMEDMVRAVEANNIHPVVDKTIFTLEQAREAYEYQVRILGLQLSVGDMLTCSVIVGQEAPWKGWHQDRVNFELIVLYLAFFYEISPVFMQYIL